MNKTIYILIAGLLLFSLPAFADGPELLFEAGNRSYLDGEYQQALDHYLQVESKGFQSGALFYNMGNVYFKQDQLGLAILYWEKAARLLGDDVDLKFNLQIAQARLLDKLDEEVKLPVWNWFDNFRTHFSVGFLTTLAMVLSFVLFGALAVKRWLMRDRAARATLRGLAWLVFALLVVDLALVGVEARSDQLRREGVLIVREAEIISAPAAGTGKLLFTLHEGTKVKVLRELENWTEISIGKKKTGWVRKDQLGVI